MNNLPLFKTCKEVNPIVRDWYNKAPNVAIESENYIRSGFSTLYIKETDVHGKCVSAKVVLIAEISWQFRQVLEHLLKECDRYQNEECPKGVECKPVVVLFEDGRLVHSDVIAYSNLLHTNSDHVRGRDNGSTTQCFLLRYKDESKQEYELYDGDDTIPNWLASRLIQDGIVEKLPISIMEFATQWNRIVEKYVIDAERKPPR